MKLLIELMVLAYLIPALILGYAYIMTHDQHKTITDFELWKIITKTVFVGTFWFITWPFVWWQYRKGKQL